METSIWKTTLIEFNIRRRHSSLKSILMKNLSS